MIGQIVGHYRVLEQIGAGGMGEVFRARDERLARDVALKLIQPSSTGKQDHLRRFEQEARAAAALSHPNIVAIYDVGFEQGYPFIVSELLEGNTLRQRLSQGPLPVSKAADYAAQIVQGLIAAHDRRIIHRDLKPENLFLTRDGWVKILDFGVAKLQSPVQEGKRTVENLTTVTKTGSVIGTVAYMSPEQLRAKPVDHRSDIFSVGTILYEMLTGNRAFRGETDVDTMTAVLREDPPEKHWEHNRIPTAFKQVVMHCLEKEPQNRFQTARDLAFALATLSTAGGGKGVSSLGFGKDQIRRIVAWASAGLACAAALVLLVVKLRPTEPETNFRRMTFEQGTVYSARFAPDGQSIIYAAAWNNQPLQLYSTPADRAQARSLELGDANLLAISRSNELALALHGAHRAHLETENGILAVSPLDGGSPRELLDDVRWADWDGKGGLAVVHHAEGLSRLEYPVGHVLYESGGWISHIRFSPRSDRIAFLDHPALWDDRGSVCVTDLAGHVIVLSSGWGSEDGLAWGPDGNEIWFTAVEQGYNRGLVSVNLSKRIRKLLRVPGGLRLQDVAADGRVLVSLDDERTAMAASERGGKSVKDLSWHDWDIAKDISRDDQWVLFEDASEAAGINYAVAIRKLDGAPPVRLGEGSAGGLSPDGKWAISVFTGAPERVTLLPIGAGQPRAVSTEGLEHVQNGSARFLSDGNSIVVNGNEPGHGVRCYLVNLAGGKPKAITPEGVEGGSVSSDDRYVLGISPGAAIAIYPLDGTPPRSVPDMDSGFTPIQWSEDSSAIYAYRAGELPVRIYQVNIVTGKKTVLRELLPGALSGVVNVAPVVTNRSASRIAYSYYQDLSVLYVMSGLR
jgi:hypothetical protein